MRCACYREKLLVPSAHDLRARPELAALEGVDEDAIGPRRRPGRGPRPQLQSPLGGLEKTAIQPVKQSGYTLFAPNGTKM